MNRKSKLILTRASSKVMIYRFLRSYRPLRTPVIPDFVNNRTLSFQAEMTPGQCPKVVMTSAITMTMRLWRYGAWQINCYYDNLEMLTSKVTTRRSISSSGDMVVIKFQFSIQFNSILRMGAQKMQNIKWKFFDFKNLEPHFLTRYCWYIGCAARSVGTSPCQADQNECIPKWQYWNIYGPSYWVVIREIKFPFKLLKSFRWVQRCFWDGENIIF